VYVDRDYNFTSVPDLLQGAAFIQSGNENKKDAHYYFLKFNLSQEATVYVAYDPRATALPAWLSGWQKLNDVIYTTDPGTSYLNIYSKVFPAGTVSLGGNLAAPAAGALTNYLVAAIPSRTTARESFFPETQLATKTQLDNPEATSDKLETKGFYPNPARDQAAIRYHLQEAATVNLTLFDKQGRSMATFVNQRKQAGTHEQIIDVQHLSDGIYLYQLRKGNNLESGKIMIKR